MVIDITPAPILSKGWGTPTNAALETLAAQAQTADEVASIASSVADAKFAEVSVDLVDATMTATAKTPSSDFAQHLDGTIAAAIEATADGRRTWAEAFAAPDADDEPTITVSTSLPTGDLIVPARVGGGSTGAPDVDFDPAFRYNGGPGAAEIDATWIGPSADEAGVSYLLHPEFVTARGNDEFWVKVYTSSTSLGVRLVIDGRWHSLELERFTVTDNTAYYVHVPFPTARARSIRFEMLGADRFGGVIVPTGETLTRPARSIEKSVVFIWDSYGGGAALPPDGASRLETAPNFVAQLLGADRFVNMSIGGTGWDPDEANDFTERFPFAVAMSPHIMLLPASRNDVTDAEDVYEAALPGLAVLAEVPVVYTFSSPLSSFSAVSEAVRDAAVANGRPYREIYGSMDGLMGPDGIHPEFEGHEGIAAEMYAAIDVAAVHQALAGVRQDAVGITLGVAPTGFQELAADVTLTATLGSTVAGVVQFRADGALLGTVPAVAGEAVFVTDALALGPHSLTARFVPADAYSYKSSTSAAVNLTILAAFLTDIILTNLLAEITVDAISGLSDGAAVTSLTPARGSKLDALVQATGSLQPVKVSADSHGHASIRFHADRLDAPDWAAATAAGTALTFYSVHRMVALGSGTQYVFRGGATGTQVSYQHSSSAAAYAVTTSASGAPTPQPNAMDTGWMVTAVTYDSGTVTVHQNIIGAPATVALTTGTMSLDGIGIGSFGGGTTGYDLRVSYVIAYTGKHSSDEIAATMLLLADVWDVALDVA